MQVVEAFKILTSDKQVKAILVNIFGGALVFLFLSPQLIIFSKQQCSTSLQARKK